jgi:hypothetical protein
MKENNLPENWLVFQEDTKKFRDNVIKYIKNNYSRAVEGSLSNHYYGIYNSILIAHMHASMDIKYKSIIITLDEFIELSKPINEKKVPRSVEISEESYKYVKLLTMTQIKAILETEYDKEDVTDIINLLNK